MTNFLPAGIINDRLEEIIQKTASLEQNLKALDIEELHHKISEINKIAEELVEFLNRFSCQPLIYTGKGTTEEVIDRLEWILTFSEVENPAKKTTGRRRPKRKALNTGQITINNRRDD